MLAADLPRRRGGRAGAAIVAAVPVLKRTNVNECGSAQSQTETLPGVDNSRRDILASCDRSNLSQEEVEGASTTSKGTDITQKSNLFNSHHGHPQRRRLRDNVVVGSRSEEHVVVPRRVLEIDALQDLPDLQAVVGVGAYQI